MWGNYNDLDLHISWPLRSGSRTQLHQTHRYYDIVTITLYLFIRLAQNKDAFGLKNANRGTAFGRNMGFKGVDGMGRMMRYGTSFLI